MPFVKIGDLYVDLNKCSFALSDFAGEGPKIKVFFEDEYYHFSLKSQAKEYKALEKYLATVETLESYNLRQIRDEVFDPFVDELPVALFCVFRELPEAEDLTLVLHASGSGEMRHRGGGGILHSWKDFESAFACFDAYKREYSEQLAVQQSFALSGAPSESFDPFLAEEE